MLMDDDGVDQRNVEGRMLLELCLKNELCI